MTEFDADASEDRQAREAEELMRQRRYADAATRYQDLWRTSPTDLWLSLGHVSALECAGDVERATQVLEDAMLRHRRSGPLHRFRSLFFTRREDRRAAALSQAALEAGTLDEGPEDQLADLYYNQGRYHEALEELQRVQRDCELDDETAISIQARIGSCLRYLDRPADGRDELLRALGKGGDHPWVLAELAECERALGEPERARARYHAALELRPEDPWVRGRLAHLELETGHTAAGIALYEALLVDQPKATWAMVELAQAIADKDAVRAGTLCRAALEIDPDFPWAHVQLGHIARRGGDLGKARVCYQQAAATAPTAVVILRELAETCRQLGRIEEARTHLLHARDLDPYDATTHGYLAELLRQEGETDAARAHLAKAVELEPDYDWAWRELAELKAQAGDHDGAFAAYQAAVKSDPDQPINDGLRAYLLRLRGQSGSALPWLERAVERHPTYLWAWRELIDHHLGAGRAEYAVAAARSALNHLPDHPALLQLLADALRRTGDRIGALAAIDLALAKGQPSVQMHGLRAEILAESGDLKAAREAAERAAAIDSGGDLPLLQAQIELASGNHAAALAQLEPRLAEDAPEPAVFELAGVANQAAGNLAGARQFFHAAILAATGGHDQAEALISRMHLRLVRLAQGAGERADTTVLDGIFRHLGTPQEAHIPWREVANAFATDRRPIDARRAVAHLLASSHDRPAQDRAGAWLATAEIELHLGALDAARGAADRALAADPTHIQARVLAAVIAEHQGDLASASSHLAQLDRLLAPGSGRAPEPALVRQLAGVLERAGRLDEAAAHWDRLCTSHPGQLSLEAERASFALRTDRLAPDAEGLAELLSRCPPQAAETARLWREHAQSCLRRHGPAAAATALGLHAEHLPPPLRLTYTQCALAAGDAATALDQVAVLRATPSTNDPEPGFRRTLDALAVRALLSTGELAAAERLAASAYQALLANLHPATTPADTAQPGSDAQGKEEPIASANAAGNAATANHSAHRIDEKGEETATLYGECLAARGDLRAALAVLAHPALPLIPSPERALMGGVLALETHGEPEAFAWFARTPIGLPVGTAPGSARPLPPLIRVLATAWPHAWPGLRHADTSASLADADSLPPLPTAALRLAAALSRHGHHRLAARILHGTATTLARRSKHGERPAQVRALLSAASAAYRRAGHSREALATAWTARTAIGVLRALVRV